LEYQYHIQYYTKSSGSHCGTSSSHSTSATPYAAERCGDRLQPKRYLTDDPVRAFRSVVAHGNWQYAPDFSALAYWARKGDDFRQGSACMELLDTMHDGDPEIIRHGSRRSMP